MHISDKKEEIVSEIPTEQKQKRRLCISRQRISSVNVKSEFIVVIGANRFPSDTTRIALA